MVKIKEKVDYDEIGEQALNEVKGNSDKIVTAKSFYITRNYSFDSHPDNPHFANISESDWKKMIIGLLNKMYNSGQIVFMNVRYHDNDWVKSDSGGYTPEPLHVHIIARYKESVPVQKVFDDFEIPPKSINNCEPIQSMVRFSKYLIHISDDALKKEKTIYTADEVINYNKEYRFLDTLKESFWDKKDGSKDETKLLSEDAATLLFNKLSEKVGKGTMRYNQAIDEIEEKAGYYWRRRFRKTMVEDVEDYVKDRAMKLEEAGRNNKNVYIFGRGGVGKSNLARMFGLQLANGRGVHLTAPLGKGKTPDALNDYTDQLIIILNEISPHGWDIEEFLAVFDQHEYARFPSRNLNKAFIGEYSIFTNSLNPLQFANDLIIYNKGGSKLQDKANKRSIDFNNSEAVDLYWQVRRRFNTIIGVRQDKDNEELVHTDVFNLRRGVKLKDGKINYNNGVHIYVGSVSYNSFHDEAPEIQKKHQEELEKLMNVSVKNQFDNVRTIDEYIEIYDYSEPVENELMIDFVAEVMNEIKWDLAPNAFLYELYKSYREMFYDGVELLKQDEFLAQLENFADDWERKKSPVRTGTLMIDDEPLIQKYGLANPNRFKRSTNPWINHNHRIGNSDADLRKFQRKINYRGFVRIN